MELHYSAPLLVLLSLLIILSLAPLQNIISEIDLKPSLTQFLIVAIFTPMLLTSMQSYSKLEEINKNLFHEMKMEKITSMELESKIRGVNSTVASLRIWAKDKEITRNITYKLNYQLEDLNNALMAYKDQYIKILTYESSYKTIEMHTTIFDQKEMILKEIMNLTSVQAQKKQLSFFDIFRVDEFYRKFNDDFLIKSSSDLKKYVTHLQKIVSLKQILDLLGSIATSYMFFLFVIIFLKAIYVEKIILTKLEKIQSIFSLTDEEKNLIQRINIILIQRIETEPLSIKYFTSFFTHTLKLLDIDKSLNFIVDRCEREKGEKICKIFLEKS